MGYKTTTRKKLNTSQKKQTKEANQTQHQRNTLYRKDGVYEWNINTSNRITQRNMTPDIHRDEEFEW